MFEFIRDVFTSQGTKELLSDNIHTKKQKPVDLYDLRDWFESLPEEDKKEIRENSTAISAGGESINTWDMKVLPGGSRTKQDFLASIASGAANRGNLDLVEKVVPKVLNTEDDSATTRHMMYNRIIKAYYKKRNEREDALEMCINYCKNDIDIVDKFLKEWDGEPPRIPSFKRLAIIYEKQGKYQEAIEVCDKALKRGLEDNTKGGFESRKERLKKKRDMN